VRSQNREIKKLEKKYDNVKKDITKTTSKLNAQLASTTLNLKESNQQADDKELTLGLGDAPAKLILPTIVIPKSNSGQKKLNAPSSSIPSKFNRNRHQIGCVS
jgi:hypothetical protein